MIKFRHKLILIFIVLITAIIASMISVVNANINEISQDRIKKNLKVSHGILTSFFVERNRSYSEAIHSLILTQPNIRAVLGTLGSHSDDDLFDDDHESDDLKVQEGSELIASTVEHLPVFQKSEVFAVFDSSGTLIYSKNNPKTFGTSFAEHKLMRNSLLGEESSSFWSLQSLSESQKSILPLKEKQIYQIFAKPVSFQSQVKGVVLVGLSLSQELVTQLKSIARADLGFSLRSSEIILSDSVAAIEPFFHTEMKPKNIFTFDSHEERFLAYPFPLKNSLGDVVGSSIMFRSMTKELEFYNNLKELFLVIGFFSSLIALLIAFFVSGSVARAISALMSGVSQVQSGNLDYEVQVTSKDEFKQLSDAFNGMTRGLKEKEMIKSTFKRYVNPKIVDDLLAEGEKLNLGGDRRQVVVLFSDIAGFTKISEKLSPEETVRFLNRYLGIMTEIVEEREGIVDKYIGDAILAYWVVTQKNQSGFEKACEAALVQQKKVDELRQEWSDSKALSQFSMRIGIHSGQALMGNIGSETRMDYTIIGDDVNTAARLESVNKQYGTNLIISNQVKEKLSTSFSCRELDSIYVVGKNEPVSIFELKESFSDEFENSFSESLKLYKKGLFIEAISSFRKHKEAFGDNVSDVFIERCEELLKKPPENWNGIYKLSSK